MFIYLTTNNITGKKYIGMCSFKGRESDNYLGSGSLLKQSIKKYGRENFTRKILEYCETREDLENSERKWIKHYNAVESDEFYNLVEGGRGGNSESLKKYWSSMTENQRKNSRNWNGHFKHNKYIRTKKDCMTSSISMKNVWKNRTETQRQ